MSRDLDVRGTWMSWDLDVRGLGCPGTWMSRDLDVPGPGYPDSQEITMAVFFVTDVQWSAAEEFGISRNFI